MVYQSLVQPDQLRTDYIFTITKTILNRERMGRVFPIQVYHREIIIYGFVFLSS